LQDVRSCGQCCCGTWLNLFVRAGSRALQIRSATHTRFDQQYEYNSTEALTNLRRQSPSFGTALWSRSKVRPSWTVCSPTAVFDNSPFSNDLSQDTVHKDLLSIRLIDRAGNQKSEHRIARCTLGVGQSWSPGDEGQERSVRDIQYTPRSSEPGVHDGLTDSLDGLWGA
jgi:hypothetical protein